MASPPILEIDTLLPPISDDEPAGGRVPYEVRNNLQEMRKEDSPDSYDADDPMRPEAPTFADWRGIIRLAEQTLQETSKDLQVVAHLTEAMTKVHGMAGLRDCLMLYNRLLEECWDRIHPLIEEEGDLELRAGPFEWLSDSGRGARFPLSVRMVPLIQGAGRGVSFHDWKQMQEGKGDLKSDDFDKVLTFASAEDCATQFEDITQCLEELQKLDNQLGQKMGNVAPGLTDLRSALGDCYGLCKNISSRKPTESAAEQGSEDGVEGVAGGQGGGGGGGGGRGRAGSRADIYRQLSQAADALQEIEPHSPVPYIIRKACEWGSLPFPELMKALVRDEAIRTELFREVGVKQEENAGY